MAAGLTGKSGFWNALSEAVLKSEPRGAAIKSRRQNSQTWEVRVGFHNSSARMATMSVSGQSGPLRGIRVRSA